MQYELKRTRAGQFRFVLRADNGKLIDPRDTYHRRIDCIKAITLLMDTNRDTPVVDLTKTP